MKLFARPDWRPWLLPLTFILLWSTASWLDWVNPKLIPPPEKVIEVALQEFQHDEFLPGLTASSYRNLLGFVLGSLLGVAFGLLLGMERVARRIFGPTFHVLRQISLFAWLPLLTTWLGQGDVAKLTFIALSAFYPVALNTLAGIRSIPAAQIEVARVYAFNRTQRLTRLILPAAAPRIFTGLQIGLLAAWLATIGADYLLASWDVGLGNVVIRGSASFNVALIVFGMLVIGIVGSAFNWLLRRIERSTLAWQQA
jgi:sulfonate transport system permease protein